MKEAEDMKGGNMHFEQVPLEIVEEQIASGRVSMMPSSDDATEDESWERLCELAAVEQDPDKLLTLVSKINRSLDEKQEALHPE